jgi:hypothetical protein
LKKPVDEAAAAKTGDMDAEPLKAETKGLPRGGGLAKFGDSGRKLIQRERNSQGLFAKVLLVAVFQVKGLPACQVDASVRGGRGAIGFQLSWMVNAPFFENER